MLVSCGIFLSFIGEAVKKDPSQAEAVTGRFEWRGYTEARGRVID